MFSRRTRWDRTRNRLSSVLEKRREAGAALLDLTASNPTTAGIEYPADLLDPLADERSRVYEPEARGLRPAREAVCADYRRRGLSVGAERIVLTASTSEAYAFLFKLLCDPGDAVLVPAPSYPLFDYLAELESVRVDRYTLCYDGQWHLPLGELAEAVTPLTRAVIVVNPNNPTGSYLKRDEAHGLAALCAERGVAVVSDEVFADYAFGEDPRRVSCVLEDGPALAFSLGGLSKSCGLPQLKLAWIAVGGPARAREEALSRLEIVADTYLSVGTPVQRALPRLLVRLPELQAPIAARLAANRAALDRRLGPGSPATLLAPEGGWYAVLRIPATVPEEQRVVQLLEERGVLVHPGFFFDFAAEAYLVLSLLAREDEFARGLGAILDDIQASPPEL
jgi:aspartate/methionine/tyrosine aminotransferase